MITCACMQAVHNLCRRISGSQPAELSVIIRLYSARLAAEADWYLSAAMAAHYTRPSIARVHGEVGTTAGGA